MYEIIKEEEKKLIFQGFPKTKVARYFRWKKLFIKISHPLSRLEGDVGSHPPGDARGACADLLRCPWRWKCQINKLGGETSWTHSRPSSAGQTWAWSPCRRGRCWRGGGGQGGTELPAAQKASSELSLSTMSKHQSVPKRPNQDSTQASFSTRWKYQNFFSVKTGKAPQKLSSTFKMGCFFIIVYLISAQCAVSCLYLSSFDLNPSLSDPIITSHHRLTRGSDLQKKDPVFNPSLFFYTSANIKQVQNAVGHWAFVMVWPKNGLMADTSIKIWGLNQMFSANLAFG